MTLYILWGFLFRISYSSLSSLPIVCKVVFFSISTPKQHQYYTQQDVCESVLGTVTPLLGSSAILFKGGKSNEVLS
jgi:hypothetical protein